jgi:hypothetical protein
MCSTKNSLLNDETLTALREFKDKTENSATASRARAFNEECKVGEYLESTEKTECVAAPPFRVYGSLFMVQ